MRIWLGAFEWRTVAGLQGHFTPAGVTSMLDLRPLIQQVARQQNLGRGAVFVTDDATLLPSPAVQIASDPLEILGPLALQRFQTFANTALQSTRLRDVLFELLTTNGDTTGGRTSLNLMPERGGHMALRCGPIQTSQALDFQAPIWTAIVRVQYQAAYRAMRARCLLVGSLFYRRLLSMWCEELGLPPEQFRQLIPADLPVEEPLPHQTVITESFDSGAGGPFPLGPDQVWTTYADGTVEVVQTWFTHDNIGNENSTLAFYTARAEADVSSANHTGSLSVVAAGNPGDNVQGGPVVRSDSASATGYYARLLNIFSTYQVGKIVSGTVTGLDSDASVTVSVPQTATLTVNGSTLSATYAGLTTHAGFTDTSISTGTRGGMNGYGGVGVDTWSLSDLAAAGNPFITRLGVLRMR